MSKIYLASASRRRQELLHQLGISFDVIVPAVSELQRHSEGPMEYVQRLALEKAHNASRLVVERALPLRPVLGADTSVVLDGAVLGKPHDRQEGEAMLRSLCGRTHTVLTAVTVLHDGAQQSAIDASQVTFRRLDAAEIAHYWETGEPADKAGAYALQGRAAAFVSRIEGSYSGVVGLPLYSVAAMLAKVGIKGA
ncbi:MAG: septum formation inhibitor Maf [Proteobacteria bacterium]|nr:septum formation inhibitor Maf [Pseudomonadota bacterium]